MYTNQQRLVDVLDHLHSLPWVRGYFSASCHMKQLVAMYVVGHVSRLIAPVVV